MLLAASALVFVIACSNVANLILARTVRREGELAIRAALGASAGALRRTLLAESLLLCGAGALLGVLIARPMVAVLSPLRLAVLGPRARPDGRCEPAVGRRRPRGGRRGAAGVRAAAAVGRGDQRVRAGGRECPAHRGHQPAAADLRGHADRGVLRAPRRRGHAADHAPRAAGGAHRLRHAPGARARTCRSPRTGARRSTCSAFYREMHAPHLGGARRRAGRDRHGGAVARRGRLRPGLPVLDRGLRPRGRRGRSARALPDRVARVLRRARRADRRGTRLHRRRSAGSGSGRHRQPEPGAPHVREPRRAQPAPAVDRSRDDVHRRQHRAPADRRRCRGHRRRARGPRAGDDRLSPVRAGDWRRAAVRAREDRSVRARDAHHAHRPRAVGRSAGRARGDARGRARRGARAGSAERRSSSASSPPWR